jgi:hypothetical protein
MIHLAKRFEAAVFALVGDGPIKQRLGRAYSRHLDDLHPDDLPDSVRERYQSLHVAMHRAAPIGKEGSLKVSIQKMSFAEASDHARRIVELYAELVRSVEREPLKIVRSEEPQGESEAERDIEPQRATAGRS